METDEGILKRHLENLQSSTKADDEDGCKIIDTISRMINIFHDNVLVSNKAELMIIANNGCIDIYQRGVKLNNVRKAKLEYNTEETISLQIEQSI